MIAQIARCGALPFAPKHLRQMMMMDFIVGILSSYVIEITEQAMSVGL
jgi:hypothetical protein